MFVRLILSLPLFLLEAAFFTLLSLPFITPGSRSLLFFLLLLMTGYSILSLMLYKWDGMGKTLFLVFPAPSILLAGSAFLQLPLFLCIILTLFIFWRGTSLYNDQPAVSESTWLILTLLLGLGMIIFGASQDSPYVGQAVLLVVFQLGVVLIGRFLHSLLSDTVKQESRRESIKFFTGTISALAAGGMLLSLLMPSIKGVFFFTLKIMVLGLGFLLTPLMKLIEDMIDIKPREREVISDMLDEGVPEPEKSNTDTAAYLDTEMIIISAAVLVILLMFFLVFKNKKKASLVQGKNQSAYSIAENHIASSKQSFFNKRKRGPENEIRKEVYQFERFAEKLGYGRYKGETLTDWWRRLGLAETDIANEIYERTRYGEMAFNKPELDEIKIRIKSLKHRIRELKENEKKKK